MEMNQYTAVFLDESREHLQAVNDHILKLEKEPHELALIEEIFRSAHTLKGMAATMEFADIASLTHQMENVLDSIRRGQLAVSTEIIDSLFLATEALEEMVEAIGAGQDGKKDVTALVGRLEQLEAGEDGPGASQSDGEQEQPALDELQTAMAAEAEKEGFFPYQITVTLSDDCVMKPVRAYMVSQAAGELGELIKTVPAAEELEAGTFDASFILFLLSQATVEEIHDAVSGVSEVMQVEVIPLKLTDKAANEENSQEETAATQVEEEAPAGQSATRKSKTIRVSLERIDDLMNLFEELVIDRSRLEELARLSGNNDLEETVEHVSRVSSEMQEIILQMRMMPVEQVFNRFPRMVRGLARELEKEIELDIAGAETEMDRTVIEEVGDPLVHLIRNSVDHGIEAPAERLQAGKPEKGKLSLRAYHSGNHVMIEIEDDGAGINRNKVESKAVENGLITTEQAQDLADEDVYKLLFSAGFSTADEVSDISGRGVGLDVVRNKIESLGGIISVASAPGKGSKFSIQLPLTLSILSALLVKVRDETYAVPLTSIVETILLEEASIMDVHGRKMMDYRDTVIPLVALREVFDVPGSSPEQKSQPVVVVQKGEKRTGLVVDSFIGQQEVVLKSLGSYLGDVFAISGATILGDGQVALIIDANALMN
ncbi:chemotaxis protein CheW [Lentibacillus sediminis]|uniref:chemotaxis protein CheW n=1 Tax=Lentibacillus sediminis TaxID=1940529 RepID=UPI000C1C201C|nr:chemotaxis protein CheA [Lentibacillus sediminis]